MFIYLYTAPGGNEQCARSHLSNPRQLWSGLTACRVESDQFIQGGHTEFFSPKIETVCYEQKSLLNNV